MKDFDKIYFGFNFHFMKQQNCPKVVKIGFKFVPCPGFSAVTLVGHHTMDSFLFIIMNIIILS